MGFFASALVILATSVSQAAAQFPPTPEGVKVLKSKFHEGITISYKEPHLCETTPGVRSFSGYVHLPPNTLNEPWEKQDYPINTQAINCSVGRGTLTRISFFWFFESRKDPHDAPLVIWLNGGPGGSSLMGALNENGPCFVGSDSNSTYLNPWSWNNEVNVLYIDEPNQVGFSYDVLTNVTRNLLGGLEMGSPMEPADFSNSPVPEQNNTFLVGTHGSQNIRHTANSTRHAAVAFWHFAQTWFEEFPAYKPHDEKISLFAESYGGKYGPAFTSYFLQQNELIANGTLSGPGTHYIHMDTLGIVNGCIDDLYQRRSYTTFTYNNTYSIRAINSTTYHSQLHALDAPGGVLDLIRTCQSAARSLDPESHGSLEKINALCITAGAAAHNLSFAPYFADARHGFYDITHPRADAFPPSYWAGFLNREWVQRRLGVPVNFTAVQGWVNAAFDQTGDFTRGGMVEDIGRVLDRRVKVAMVYGDRDWICNWIGGETVSLHVPHAHAASFRSAGYAPISLSRDNLNSGGQVRQYGNLSFSRVYQAGHMVPSYQPEASWQIFMRALFNKDIATGTIDLKERDWDYSSEGPDSTWRVLNDVLPAPEPVCYLLEPVSCTKELWEAVGNGTAIVKDWVVVGVEEGDGEVKQGGLMDQAQTVLSDGRADL